MTRKVKKLFFCGAKSFRSDQLEHDLPEGRIRVCVGRDVSQQRLDVEAVFLNHPLFRDLLHLSEDEFGYSYAGALRIACDVDLFLHLVELLRSSDPAVHCMELSDLLTNFSTSSNNSFRGNSGGACDYHR